jgi:hypothetical protein
MRSENVTTLLADIHVNKLQIVREIWALFVIVAAEEGSTSWVLTDEIFGELYWLSATEANTKTLLEDIFNKLRDIQRQSKNKRVSRWRSGLVFSERHDDKRVSGYLVAYQFRLVSETTGNY